MGRKKINPKIKQLDAAVRLVLGKKKKASVVVSRGGVVYSTGLDAAAPSGTPMPKGVYVGEELLGVYDILKHADEVKLEPAQDPDGNWQVKLFDPAGGPAAAVCLTWQDCADVEAETPEAGWPLEKSHLKMLKTAYKLATTLDKSQLRILRFDPAGVISYLSPTTVAQWFAPEWREATVIQFEVDVADVKRAVLYRGAKLIAVGTSSGKINFAYDDGAFLRVDRYDGDGYDDTQLGRVFDFNDESSVWRLGADQPAQELLALIAGGGNPSETTGTMFCSEFGEEPSQNMPMQIGAGKFYPKVINELATWAESIQPSSPASYWANRRIAFYGPGYRAVTSMSYDHEEALRRGIIEDASASNA